MASSQRFRIVPVRSPWRRLGAAVAVLLIAGCLYSLMLNPRWGWSVMAQYFFSAPVLAALWRTLWLTALSATLGFLLGGVLAFARLSESKLLSGLSWVYIWLLRSIPLIVLLLVLNNLGYLYPTVNIGVPFTDLLIAQYRTTDLIDIYTVAIIGLSLNQAAFSAEIIRGGILSVDHGQREAAAALGLSRRREALRIVLPQAMRAIVPPAFNEVINMAKSTSVLYILALPELFYTVQVIYRRNLEVIPLLMVATVWYLIILTVLSALQSQIERYFARGTTRGRQLSLFSSMFQRNGVPEASAASSDRKLAFLSKRKPQISSAIVRSGEGAVSIQGISRRFGGFVAIDDVNLEIVPGDVVAIIGPSGAGKSTLLRMINHLERPDQGLITIDGEAIGYRQQGDVLYELPEPQVRERRSASHVFQSFNLFHISPCARTSLKRHGRAEARPPGLPTWGDGLLERIGLGRVAEAYPRQLSGGHQLRVAIARALALAQGPALRRADSASIPKWWARFSTSCAKLASSGTTMVVVTHEIGFAREVATKVVFMEHGKVLEVGSPEQIFRTPGHPRTAAFLAKVL